MALLEQVMYLVLDGVLYVMYYTVQIHQEYLSRNPSDKQIPIDIYLPTYFLTSDFPADLVIKDHFSIVIEFLFLLFSMRKYVKN